MRSAPALKVLITPRRLVAMIATWVAASSTLRSWLWVSRRDCSLTRNSAVRCSTRVKARWRWPNRLNSKALSNRLSKPPSSTTALTAEERLASMNARLGWISS
ncbi:hypothetical protein D3C76_1266430 [compost metagenome]